MTQLFTFPLSIFLGQNVQVRPAGGMPQVVQFPSMQQTIPVQVPISTGNGQTIYQTIHVPLSTLAAQMPGLVPQMQFFPQMTQVANIITPNGQIQQVLAPMQGIQGIHGLQGLQGIQGIQGLQNLQAAQQVQQVQQPQNVVVQQAQNLGQVNSSTSNSMIQPIQAANVQVGNK